MSDKTWDRVSGLLMGAVAGFVAGVLLAPSKGSETRESLKNRTQTSLDQVSDSVREIRDSLTEKSKSLLKRSVTEIEVQDSDKSPSTTPDEDQGA